MSNITSHTYPLLDESPWPLFGVFVLILIILVTAFSWSILNSDRELELEEPDLEEPDLEGPDWTEEESERPEVKLEIQKLELELELKDLEYLERLEGRLIDKLSVNRNLKKLRFQHFLVQRVIRKKAEQS